MARGQFGMTEVAVIGIAGWLLYDNFLREKIATYGGLSPYLSSYIPGNGEASGQDDLLVGDAEPATVPTSTPQGIMVIDLPQGLWALTPYTVPQAATNSNGAETGV